MPVIVMNDRGRFARRLKTLRIAGGYDTAREFASRLGINEAAYARWERGETEPNISFIVLICQILNISADALLLGRKNEKMERGAEPPKE
jgi:transcriptional regulator with XRE-family HTH domain